MKAPGNPVSQAQKRVVMSLFRDWTQSIAPSLVLETIILVESQHTKYQWASGYVLQTHSDLLPSPFPAIVINSAGDSSKYTLFLVFAPAAQVHSSDLYTQHMHSDTTDSDV